MRNLLLILLAVLSIAVILLLQPALQFSQSIGAVPPGVQLAGNAYRRAGAAEVAAALDNTYAEPVAVFYAGQRIILRPKMLGFEVDADAMLAEAQGAGTLPRVVLQFFGELIRYPPRPVEIPLQYTYNHEALDSWLADVANRYDRPATDPRPIVSQLTIAPGQPGWQLDLPGSRERVLAALASPQARNVDLALREAPAPPIDMKALETLLRARLDEFSGIAGVFLHEVDTGQELAINGDVAYSGLVSMRIPILEETYRKLNGAPDVATRRLISETMTLGALEGNQSANQLLELIGDGDAQAGVAVLGGSLKTLGLRSTFMAAPYGEAPAGGGRIATPANSRTDLNTDPDPYMQTTPRDMGLMLEMLVECSQGGGPLLAAYAGQLSAAECGQALAYMALNDVHDLVTKIVPPGTRMAHRHAYSAETHADNAAIWGPAGPYVLTVYLYAPRWLQLDVSAQTMQDISQAVWNYYTKN